MQDAPEPASGVLVSTDLHSDCKLYMRGQGDVPTRVKWHSRLVMISNQAGLGMFYHHDRFILRWRTAARLLAKDCRPHLPDIHPSLFHGNRTARDVQAPFAMRPPPGFPPAPTNAVWPLPSAAPAWQFPPAHTTILRLLFPAAAPLRWASLDGLYTDGAAVKKGGATSLGAAVYNARLDRTFLVDPCGVGATNTITRAELGAIDQALYHAPPSDVFVFTDSACSLALARRMAFLPASLLECKHNALLRSLVASLLQRAEAGLHTHLCKVVAHVGIHGNEQADKGASAVVGGASTDWSVDAGNDSTLDLPAWLVMADPPACASGSPAVHANAGRPWALSNLTTALKAAVDMRAYAPGTARRTYYTTLRDKVAAVSDSASSNAMWLSRPYSTCRLVLQVRYGTLNCPALAARQRRPYMTGARVLDASCPLCRAPHCSAGHVLGGCTHRTLKGMYINRHNGAVRMLHEAVMNGSKGSSLLCAAIDAGPRDALPEGALGTRLQPWLVPDACLPAEHGDLVLSADERRTKLRPDLLYISGLPSSAVPRDPTRMIPHRRRAAATVYLLEVGYVSDSSDSLDAMLARKREQHATLCRCLQLAGWRVHSGAPIVLPLGTAGTVYNAWRDTAVMLGVPVAATLALLRALHLHSVDSAVSINRTRLHLERHPDDANGHA